MSATLQIPFSGPGDHRQISILILHSAARCLCEGVSMRPCIPYRKPPDRHVLASVSLLWRIMLVTSWIIRACIDLSTATQFLIGTAASRGTNTVLEDCSDNSIVIIKRHYCWPAPRSAIRAASIESSSSGLYVRDEPIKQKRFVDGILNASIFTSNPHVLQISLI